MEENRLRFHVCIILHLIFWVALVTGRARLDCKSEPGIKLMRIGMFNIFWMTLIYIQGQMAEMDEPTKITNYLTFVAVDAVVTFFSVLITYKVSV